MSLLTDVESLMAGITPLYIGNMPASPDNAVCIYPTSGYPRSLSGTMVEEPTFMVKVRNASYPTGYDLCNTIKDLLHGTKATDGIMMIQQQGDINGLGQDETGREEFTINFRCYYRRP